MQLCLLVLRLAVGVGHQITVFVVREKCVRACKRDMMLFLHCELEINDNEAERKKSLVCGYRGRGKEK